MKSNNDGGSNAGGRGRGSTEDRDGAGDDATSTHHEGLERLLNLETHRHRPHGGEGASEGLPERSTRKVGTVRCEMINFGEALL